MARSLIGSSLTAALFFVGAARLHAQTSTAPMIETASLIGASVFAADGTLVGEVADVLVIDSRIVRIRVKTDVPLGIGERVVELQDDAFTAVKGAVALKLTAKELRLLAPVPQREEPTPMGSATQRD